LNDRSGFSLIRQAPAFADPGKSLAASQIFVIVRAFILASIVLLISQAALAPGITGRGVGMLLATVAVGLIVLQLNRLGRVRLAALLLVLSLWLIISILALTESGLGSRLAWGYFIVVFVAGLVLGKWSGIIWAGICSASTLMIALAAPMPSSDPVRFWLINTIYLVVVLLLQDLASRSIRESMARAHDEVVERRRSENALLARNQFVSSLLRAIPVAVFFKDREGKYTGCNDAFTEILGVTADEIKGKTVHEIWPSELADTYHQKDLELMKEKKHQVYEFQVKDKLGDSRPVIYAKDVFIDANGEVGGLVGAFLDISDRKQSEMERERIVSLLKATLESTADGILVVDLEGRITDYNAHFADMWQIPDEILPLRKDDDAIASVKSLLVDPEGFVARVRQIYEDSMQESHDLFAFKDGRYIECYSRPQMLNGHAVGRVWSHRDISERKRAEKALFLNSQRTQVLLQFGQMTGAPLQEITDFALEKSVELTGSKIGYIAFLNEDESILTMNSWSKSAMEECAIDDKPIVYSVAATGLWGEAVRQRRPVITNDYSASPWKKGYPQGHVVLDRHLNVPVFQGARIVLVAGVGNKPEDYNQDDVRQLILIMEGMWRLIEHKQAEVALMESERRYRTLFESSRDAIFLQCGDTFIDCNAKTLELFGCTREEFAAESPDRFSPARQPDGSDSRAKAMILVQAALAGRPQRFDWIHLHWDGTAFPAEVILSRVELSRGMFLLAVVRDISDRRRLEEQLLQAQKMEAIGILAGGVAHDFNNILSTIVGYGSLLQMKLAANKPLKEYTEKILASCERAVSLTSSLLTFSRKQEIELKPFDVNDMIYNFHKILGRLIGEDIDFSLDLASRSLVVDADVRQIEQVLMNLATNSRDSMLRGGKLVIGTQRSILKKHFGEIPPGSYAIITVTDNGSGMNQQVKAHIFEPFFTTKEVGKGTGLGLAIVYGIVKKHGGFILVDSAPSNGTRFSIYLPLRSSLVQKRQRSKEARIPSGSETILLIEDDPSVRQVTRSLLEEYGYHVLEAADGTSGQEVFRQQMDRIRLVLCDLIMPGLDGRETLQGIWELKRDVKAIFMSGYTADIIAGKGLADSGFHLLLKPLSPGVLLKKVRAVLDGA